MASLFKSTRSIKLFDVGELTPDIFKNGRFRVLSLARDRLQFLDALRGIAALSVVAFHYTLDLRDQGVLTGASLHFASTIGDGLDLGKIGVALFFMISGYIIPNSLSAVSNDTGRFAQSRFFRLYPVYWVILLPSFLLPWPDLNATFSPSAIVANLTMLQGFMGQPNIIGAAWTLQIELVFYGCCVLLALSGRLDRPKVNAALCLSFLVMALALAVARGLLVKKLPVALPLALSLMFFGTLWRDATLRRVKVAQTLSKLVLPTLVVTIVPISVIGYNHDFGYHEHWQSYVTCYFIAIAMFTLGTTLAKLDWRPLVFVGEISYSLYLIHPLIASVAFRVGFRAASVPLHPLIYEAILIALALAAAWATFELVERPFVRLGRWLTNWRSARRQIAAE